MLSLAPLLNLFRGQIFLLRCDFSKSVSYSDFSFSRFTRATGVCFITATSERWGPPKTLAATTSNEICPAATKPLRLPGCSAPRSIQRLGFRVTTFDSLGFSPGRCRPVNGPSSAAGNSRQSHTAAHWLPAPAGGSLHRISPSSSTYIIIAYFFISPATPSAMLLQVAAFNLRPGS